MIRLTIQRKVFLATLALAATLVVLLAAVMRWNLGQGFERYTTEAEFARLDWLIRNVESAYAANGSWEFVRVDPERAWRRLSRRDPAENAPPPRPERFAAEPPYRPPPPAPRADGDERPRPPANDPLRFGARVALLDADGRWLAGNPSDKAKPSTRPVRHQGTVVGHLALEASAGAVQELDAAFLASQTRNLLLAGATALALALFAAWLLARHLLAPIRDLDDGVQRIAAGELGARIPVRGDDELGELAQTFNDMADRLARIEESRRAWIADASHELRTPLAVLRAEIEAMQDGVRTADAATLARLLKQVQQLATLVDDLRKTLDQGPGDAAMDDQPFQPMAVLDDTVAAFRERFAAAGLALELRGARDAPLRMRGDAGRLTQVFANLLENSLRYTDPGGRLRITAGLRGPRLVLLFDDTAPAPPRTALPRLFERFFRAEPSRARASGGSGLGLAICKTFVEAHGGTITAQPSELGGLCIRIELPVERT